MATTEELLKQQAAAQPSRTDQINALYDAQKEAQLNALKGAYEQNLSNAQAARDKLPGQYQQSANDLATQYERNRLNLNRQFSANGINTGAASQAQLSRSNEYLRDFGKLKAAENQAIADADRGINDLTAAYNRNVASAGASVEASRTGALLDEGARQQQQDLNKAQLLAGYGDFSGFAALYGQDVANNMATIWKAQNPDLAYRTGQMTAQEYKNITGKWPAGYSVPYSYVGPKGPKDDGGDGKTTLSDTEFYYEVLLPAAASGDASSLLTFDASVTDKYSLTPEQQAQYNELWGNMLQPYQAAPAPGSSPDYEAQLRNAAAQAQDKARAEQEQREANAALREQLATARQEYLDKQKNKREIKDAFLSGFANNPAFLNG